MKEAIEYNLSINIVYRTVSILQGKQDSRCMLLGPDALSTILIGPFRTDNACLDFARQSVYVNTPIAACFLRPAFCLDQFSRHSM